MRGGSLYDRLQGLSDPRKAKGKRYSLLTLLVVIFLAKLSGHASRKPGEIADKGNQPRLYQDIEQLFAPQQPIPGFGQIATDFQQAQTSNHGHGRLEVRTIQTSEMLNDYLDWPGVGQVYRLERKFSWLRQGPTYKTSREVEWGLTSLSRQAAPPDRLLAIRRYHWLIETGLHYRRDVTFHEDATRMTLGAAGHTRSVSMIHDLVLGLLKTAGFTNAAQGRRWFDGHLQEAFALLIR